MYGYFGLHSSDCSTGEFQPHTSEIITGLEKVLLATSSVLNLLIMLLLLLRYLITFRKRSSLSGYIRLLQNTEYLQLEATDSTKNVEIPGTSRVWETSWDNF